MDFLGQISQNQKIPLNSDFNNNKAEVLNKFSNDSIPEPRHSKFCHSKDISEKEESLRNCRASTSSQINAHSCKEKKSVTFDNTIPVYLNISKKGKRIYDFVSDSDDDLLDPHFADVASETDLLSPSDSEFFHSRDTEKLEIISIAERKLTTVLNKLQAVWLDVHGTETIPKIAPALVGGHNLLEVVGLITFVAEQMEVDYRKFLNVPSDLEKLAKLESSNEFLKDQLESSKMVKTCLESEIKYLNKEKSLLNEEVKELTYKMAVTGSKDAPHIVHIDDKSPKTEVFYRNPHQRFLSTNSTSSAVPIPQSEERIAEETLKLNNSTEKEKGNEVLLPSNKEKLPISAVGEKLESDFDSIMDYVKLRGTEMDSLQSQLQSYDQEIHGLRKMINCTHFEKQELLSELESVIDEQKALLRERDHYESILKLILKEKTSNDFNLQDLLKNLITKLNSMSMSAKNIGSLCQTSLLEGAIQTVQEQNSSQREEISKLKEQLSTSRLSSTKKVSELETAHAEVSKQLENLSKELKEKDESLKSDRDECNEKYEKLQDLHTAVNLAKTALEKSIIEKEDEVKILKESVDGLQRTNLRQHNKLNNLHRTNVKLVKEIEELKLNMEQLASIISQLRSSLKEHKTQWTDRLRVSTDEASQSKEHCRWLQSQIEHMNEQLTNAHNRIKAHETDKTHLAQQVLLAEEERKIVDRKLQELRAALQGDTVLREALIERNETLQFEINRLRRSKLASLAGGGNGFNHGIEENHPPPSEMSKAEDPMSVIQVIDHNHIYDKLGMKKNRYPSTSTSRRGNDAPRTAVSLHNGSSVQGSND